ncbi:hypothetical protein N431DRAFT_564542 [Stipitochalara longipes BDJ]|nr:hypothetical protein N431DRAFT_564542 [Stipitochalara longipes BDJ]
MPFPASREGRIRQGSLDRETSNASSPEDRATRPTRNPDSKHHHRRLTGSASGSPDARRPRPPYDQNDGDRDAHHLWRSRSLGQLYAMRLWKSNRTSNGRVSAACASPAEPPTFTSTPLQGSSTFDSQSHTTSLATSVARVIIDDQGLVRLADQDEALQLAKEKCLRELSSSNYQAQLDRIPTAVTGTCQWLLHHETYSEWRQNHCSSLLWLSADSGFGKSVLARYLVEHLKNKGDPLRASEVVCYFFFKADNCEQDNAVSAVRAILHQLYTAQPWLLEHAAKRYLEEPASKRSRMLQNFDTLWRILEESVRDSTSRDIFLVLDGLDECGSVARSQLLQSLNRFYMTEDKRLDQAPLVKMIVSSCSDADIKMAFDTFPIIRFNGEAEEEAIRKDVDLVIKDRIDKAVLSGFPRNIFEDLEIALTKGVDRTFVWASTAISLLESKQGAAQGQVVETLLSRDVYRIYDRLLEDSSNQEEAWKMLQILVAAFRPLTLAEMSIAIAVDPVQMTFEDLDTDVVRNFEQRIKALCGNFVRIINKTIYLVHETAREFLLRSPDIQSQRRGEWQHSIALREAHSQLLDICLLYLSFLNNATTFTHPSQIPQSDINPHLFVEYAGRFWTRHYAEVAPSLKPNQLARCANLCKPNSRAFKKWFQYASSNVGNPRRAANEGLIQQDIAACFGLDEVAKLLKEDLKPETVAWVDDDETGLLDENCVVGSLPIRKSFTYRKPDDIVQPHTISTGYLGTSFLESTMSSRASLNANLNSKRHNSIEESLEE